MKLRSDTTIALIAVGIFVAWRLGWLDDLLKPRSASTQSPVSSMISGMSAAPAPVFSQPVESGAQVQPVQPFQPAAAPQAQPVAPAAQVQAAQPIPAAPPIKVDYGAVQASITPEPGGSTSHFVPSDPQGQINAQVASNMQMVDSSKNFGLIGTIPGGGNDVKVFTASGWLSCAAMRNVNEYSGDTNEKNWYFAMPPEYRQKAVDACRGAGY